MSAGVPEKNTHAGASILGELHGEIMKLKFGQRLIQWMVSFNIILSIAIVVKLFTP